jgi:hypothetical protein
MMEDYEYPTEEQLEKIRTWKADCKESIHKCFDYIESLWWGNEWGFVRWTGDTPDDYILHTDGWSGNEEIIDAMKENFMLWMLSWYESRRGGQYKFRVIGMKEDE